MLVYLPAIGERLVTWRRSSLVPIDFTGPEARSTRYYITFGSHKQHNRFRWLYNVVTGGWQCYANL
jgi:hypothetical protein